LPVLDDAVAVLTSGAVGILATGLVLGIRHGFDWDHIAAITDITSTSAAGRVAETAHEVEHLTASGHVHAHGGRAEIRAHATGSAAIEASPAIGLAILDRARFVAEQRRAIVLGTLYALGHALVVLILGLLALSFGAVLPGWVDPIMGRIVGVTLVALGIWVFVSLYHYARHGEAFRLRSRWMLVFDGVRYAWRRLAARIHGHEHVEPMEMSSYGRRTAFGVGMIHGIGAETGSQALLIATVGGAAGAGLGAPMLLAFIAGLLISNTLVVVLSATGFVAGQVRTSIYLVIGLVAGVFSLAVGLFFLFGNEGVLPDLQGLFGFLGSA
jgi:high-affinity nickel-transport protein